MKKIILVLALCATFITSAFADETQQGQVVGSGEIPEATAPAQQSQQALPEKEAPKQEPVKQEDCPPAVQAPVTPPLDDCPKEEPRIVHQSKNRTIVRYMTVTNRTVVREVDNRQLDKLRCDFAAYKREIDARFQMAKSYTDDKADQAYVKSVGTSNRYTDAKVEGLRKELAPRLDAVEEQSNALALVALVLGIIALVGLILWGVTRR